MPGSLTLAKRLGVPEALGVTTNITTQLGWNPQGHDAAERLDADEKGVTSIHTPGGDQAMLRLARKSQPLTARERLERVSARDVRALVLHRSPFPRTFAGRPGYFPQLPAVDFCRIRCAV
jgi:hypothetical protein